MATQSDPFCDQVCALTHTSVSPGVNTSLCFEFAPPLDVLEDDHRAVDIDRQRGVVIAIETPISDGAVDAWCIAAATLM
jgi:hypothetical protein